jgi:hypothetical protein
MRKFTKTVLHLWFSLVSVAALAFGWAFLAHAEKPLPLVEPQPQVLTIRENVLEPIPSISDLQTNSSRKSPVFQNPTVTFPRLRTRGS